MASTSETSATSNIITSDRVGRTCSSDSYKAEVVAVCVEFHREQLGSGEKSVPKRYYLTSHEPDAKRLQQLIRQHWSIENQCHWVLDVTLDEDQCRARKDHAAQGLAMLRKVCLSLLKQDTSIKDSLRGKRYQAALDETVLEGILFPESPK
ncbi:ISAs1 family transposase [Haloferula sp.]|uniref:ISAs1 family transposase n=1 Tax=Haloferula sp. TaxID=2497595 RepID=UPI003C75D0D0